MSNLIIPAQGLQVYPSQASFRHRGSNGGLTIVYIGAANQTALTTFSATTGNLRAYPVVIGDAVTIDTLYVEATATVANAVGRVGIYLNTADGTIYPSSLVVESGEVALATAVVRSAAVNVTLQPGLYWFASLTGTAAPTLRAHAVGGVNHVGGMSSAFALQTHITVAQAYGAMPATFTGGGTWTAAGTPPAVGVHYA